MDMWRQGRALLLSSLQTRIIFALLACALFTLIPHAYANQDSNSASAAHTKIRLPNVHPGRDAVYAHAKQLLTEALLVTQADYGTFEFVVSSQESPQRRQLRSLEHDLLDITWSVTSSDREAYFLPIRIPIMAGLFGKRVLLINAEDTRFSKDMDITDLKEFRAVLGYDWPDTTIFRKAGIPVLETTYRASFKMVSEGFADMFPRSVMEVLEEMEHKDLSKGLVVEDNIVISYPSPIFFFVGSNNQQLATRITEGLLQLLKNHRFQQLLKEHKGFQQSLALVKGRTVISIDNPLLSKESQKAIENFLPLFAPAELLLNGSTTDGTVVDGTVVDGTAADSAIVEDSVLDNSTAESSVEDSSTLESSVIEDRS
ncbi:amino acid ABC transporter substrate-binding protein [Alteromonas genovensis]|uniref:Amino acid ABC transporter substrate-binding protein n=1 Tax=Alteromonas genovensis TaxID=471225 RepID=A0A6N9TLG3_9ALTE|nr:amino acid ABC transporter substrate-binding protein [Alteromonas genovensis]NDW16706.1 amino acid ABC transporter substrate-binding protein [Alteromonas genovensis]